VEFIYLPSADFDAGKPTHFALCQIPPAGGCVPVANALPFINVDHAGAALFEFHVFQDGDSDLGMKHSPFIAFRTPDS